MYIPPAFRVDDPNWVVAFLQVHSFATLVTIADGVPFASHLPVLYEANDDQGILIAHVARANPQWRHFGSAEVLTIFTGPHAYISPMWYECTPAVPTWNYAAVHVYGVPRIIPEKQRVADRLKLLVNHFESSQATPWDGQLPERMRDSLLEAIVAFEIPITRIEAKTKLGQNRSEADRRGMIEHLRQGSETQRALAQLIGAADCVIDRH
jgi:transcriptional regulator